ncbi:hypothetical protein J4416_01480 [Candidatus Pacearchaeota archaeon]|nr:hypothetical protein [Candidatus Pacearchaeota archaeon]
MVKKGIPKDVIDQLDIHTEIKEEILTVTPVVESHQIKLPIPLQIRHELQIEKGQKCKVRFDKEAKEIIYSFK